MHNVVLNIVNVHRVKKVQIKIEFWVDHVSLLCF